MKNCIKKIIVAIAVVAVLGAATPQVAKASDNGAILKAGYEDFLANNPQVVNQIAEVYAVSPSEGIDTELAWLSFLAMGSYDAYYEEYINLYAATMAMVAGK